jgi:hypothetical protein
MPAAPRGQRKIEMTAILIIGANGEIARVATRVLLTPILRHL